MLLSQDALESAWGRSAQGKFNFGNLTTGKSWKGAYVEGRDHDAAGKPITNKFRAYDSIDEYAVDKIQFLKRLYDFDENDDITAFASKLTGENKGKRKYAEKIDYGKILTDVYNGIIAKGQDGLKIDWNPAPKDTIDIVGTVKEYGPSFALSFISGNASPFINKLLEGKKPALDYTHKFGSTDDKFKEFASVMTPIFKEALEKNGYPLTNLNNIVRQAALESSYGLSPRGERGFNLGGIKHPGDSIAPKYKKTKHTDGEYYIDFDNLGDYANYKVKLLNDRYNALEAKNTNDFIDRLHGNNPSKSSYSADRQSYTKNLNGTVSLNRYLNRGGIIKYQEPAQGIQRRDAIKDYTPQIPLSGIKWAYNPTQQPVLTQDNRSKWQHEQASKKADRGYNDYMEAKKTEQGLDRLNQFVTFTDYAGLATGVGGLLGKGVRYAGKKAVKKLARDFANNQRLGIVAPQFQSKSDITDRFLKFVGGRKGIPVDINKLRGAEKLQALKLQEAGVDLSKVSQENIKAALQLREWQVMKTSPEGRFNVIKPTESASNHLIVSDYNKVNGRETKVGETQLFTSKSGNISIGGTNNVSNNPNIHKVEERGLNSAIQLSNQSGLNGVITGSDLKSAPKTYKVWEHFPEKELYSTTGVHSNSNMVEEALKSGKIQQSPDIDKDVLINNISQMKGDSKRLLLNNAPVYKLTKPSSLPTITKSTVFDPNIIDKAGKMNIDWNDSNIFRVGLSTMLGNQIFNTYGNRNK